MLVREMMNKNIVTAEPDITVKEAAKMMSQFHIGSLVILKDKKIVGIITERTVLVAIAQGKDVELTTVEEIMTKDVITIDPDKTVKDAVDVMSKNRIKKLPVVDGDKPIGIVTCSDIAVVEPRLIEELAKLVSVNITGYRGG